MTPKSFGPPSAEAPLVTVSLDGAELCSIRRAPAEERRVARLDSPHPVLTFTDAGGTAYRHDLTSVVQEGCPWLHLSVRVPDLEACQADALIHTEATVDEAAFRNGDVRGIRFQPFYLPQGRGDPKELAGQGLFYRGLHVPGTMTPANVSLSCLCDHCGQSFRLQSFHAGFGLNAYFYCNRGPHTFVTGTFVEGAPPPMGAPDPAALAGLEARLPRCAKCGGAFQYANPFPCPHCGRAFIDFAAHPHLREREHYGNYLYGDGTQEWELG